MNRLAIAGGLSLVGGVVGYAAGIAAAYPGRSFSVTAVMIGVTLLAMRNVPGNEKEDGDGNGAGIEGHDGHGTTDATGEGDPA